jgi:[ribosomal protein S5]-alanine N-acetyltransferase
LGSARVKRLPLGKEKYISIMNNVIQTKRLLLRSFISEDIEPIFKIQSDPIAMKYTICTKTIQETGKRLLAYAEEEKKLGFAPWTVLLRSENKIIGWGGLNTDPFNPGWGVEVVYFFHPSYWGKGFGTELVKISLNIGFNNNNLTEIHAFAHKENIGSIRVLEKNGFSFLRFEPKLNRNHYVIQKKM